jgi:type IV pilus assembly protein PilM
MFGLLKSRAYSIGVDIGDDSLKLVQLAENGNGMDLIASRSEERPEDIKPGGGKWQRWAIDTIRQLTGNGDFRGREVVAAMPAADVFIEHLKMPKTDKSKLEDAVFSRIKQKLPFEPLRDNTVLKCLTTEDDNALVMAMERRIIDVHLAIYEKAGLQLRAINVWPMALTNCYARFFGRRKSDLEAVVMLIDVEAAHTNVVICRHRKLLFARSISIGSKQLADEQAITRLVLELTGCKRHFSSIYRSAKKVERLIFLSGQAADKQECASIAKQLEMPAQIGDCLAAVRITDPYRLGIDRRISASDRVTAVPGQERINWAIAFGLSLS